MKRWLDLARKGVFGRGRTLRDRAPIIAHGERVEVGHLLAEGAAEIFHRARSGSSVVVKLVTAPTILGSPELLVREPEFLASIRAAKNARVYRMTREQYVDILRTDPAANLEAIMDIGIAFTGAARYEPSRLFESEALLATLVLAYADVFGEVEDGAVRITLKRSQAQLASEIGSSERSVQRILTRWKQRGILTKRRGLYLVVDPHVLEGLAGDLAGSLVHRWREL
jgi:CRP-like cAMP-binding protein